MFNLQTFPIQKNNRLNMARKALIDNDIIGIFRDSPFVYGNISTQICSRNISASVVVYIAA